VNTKKLLLVIPLGSLFLVPLSSRVASAQPPVTIVASPVRADVSPDLATMIQQQPVLITPGAPDPRPLRPLIEELIPSPSAASASAASSAYVQTKTAPRTGQSASVGTTFEGNGTGLPGFSLTGAPPDTTLAVGPNHIVQWVNSQFAIFNKTGSVLIGPVNGNTLFTGFGGLCETINRGDPLVAYDKMADRWVFSQFAFGAGTTAPYFQCFAVSTTSNPAGPYYRYAYQFSAVSPSGLNDYGKLGIWPNAYYMSYNMFGGSPAGSNTGVALCAHDRVKMLAGDPLATMLCAPIAFYGGGASFLPADLEGNTSLPAANAPGLFMRYSTTQNLRIVRLSPDFVAGTVTLNDGQGGAPGSFVNIPTGPLTLACNGTGGTCVPQPGTAQLLDTVGSRLMYRLGYRNRGGVESLIVNIATDPDGAGSRASAIRWFEVRNPFSATPTMFQNATFNPDSSDRWMASMGMDKQGNIAMGYSVANASLGVKPSIRITGRLRSDVRNRMQTESVIINGTGSQTTTLSRWGDYSTMRVDPSDDCTFWYTNEYLAADGTFNWRTRIGSYKFPTCQ
jgi:hypothetical protein